MGAEDPHRYNRGERLCNYEPQPRLGGLQAAVEGPRAFRKNQRCISGLEDANKGLQGAAVDPLLTFSLGKSQPSKGTSINVRRARK